MVFQNYALWPHMTVFQNVAYGLKLRRLGRDAVAARVGEGLRKVNLVGFESRYPGQLSGGQQQRVALARALVLNPDILLLDEPLSNLDAKIRVQVRAEIRKLQRELGITTVYVTHDQEEALSLSDRVAVMRDGRVLQLGAPRELYERPRTRFVADFVGTNNLIPGTVKGQDGETLFVDTALGPLRARAMGGVTPGQPCVLAIRPENVAVGGPGEYGSGRTARASDPQVGGSRGGPPEGRDVPSAAGARRPGELDVGTPPLMENNRVVGRVTLASYLGNTLRYDIEAGGATLKADIRDPWHHEPLAAGTEVALAFPASVTLALPHES